MDITAQASVFAVYTASGYCCGLIITKESIDSSPQGSVYGVY